VISSLKLLINCDTCVRASPVSCAAAGSCVIWLSVSRALVRWRFTVSASTCCDGVGDGVVGVVSGG
jgi:hypothetical protein